jgi:hypothetical protein
MLFSLISKTIQTIDKFSKSLERIIVLESLRSRQLSTRFTINSYRDEQTIFLYSHNNFISDWNVYWLFIIRGKAVETIFTI